MSGLSPKDLQREFNRHANKETRMVGTKYLRHMLKAGGVRPSTEDFKLIHAEFADAGGFTLPELIYTIKRYNRARNPRAEFLELLRRFSPGEDDRIAQSRLQQVLQAISEPWSQKEVQALILKCGGADPIPIELVCSSVFD